MNLTTKKIVSAIATLTIISGMGVAIAINAPEKEHLITQAAWIEPNTRLYFSPGSEWDKDEAWFAAYFYEKDVQERGWIKLTEVTGKTPRLFYVDYPNWSWSNRVIFTRMDSGKTALEWDSRWNQTGDLEYNGEKQHYVVPNDGNAWNSGALNDTYWTNLYENESVAFSQSFTSTIGGACDASGQTNNITSGMWTAQSTAYNALQPGSKTYFVGNGSNASILAAKSLHNYIVNKYGYSNIY